MADSASITQQADERRPIHQRESRKIRQINIPTREIRREMIFVCAVVPIPSPHRRKETIAPAASIKGI